MKTDFDNVTGLNGNGNAVSVRISVFLVPIYQPAGSSPITSERFLRDQIMAAVDGAGPALTQKQGRAAPTLGLRSNVLGQELPDTSASFNTTISKKEFDERLTNLAETVNVQLEQFGLKPTIMVSKGKEAETLLQVLRKVQGDFGQLQQIDPQGTAQTISNVTEFMSSLPPEVSSQVSNLLQEGRLRFGTPRDRRAYAAGMLQLQDLIDKMK